MKPVEKVFTSMLSLLLIVLCLPTEHKSQTRLPKSETRQKTSSAPKEDISNWQSVDLREKGIRFKLPSDWRHDEEDTKTETDYTIIEFFDWNSPRQERIRIEIATKKRGFPPLTGSAASKEEMLQEKLNEVTKLAKGDPLYGGVKKLKLGEVEGVFRIAEIMSFGGNKVLLWTGYRIHQGKAQEIELGVGGNPKSISLLQAVFNTFEFEQD